jgi:hypothetical protein
MILASEEDFQPRHVAVASAIIVNCPKNLGLEGIGLNIAHTISQICIVLHKTPLVVTYYNVFRVLIESEDLAMIIRNLP